MEGIINYFNFFHGGVSHYGYFIQVFLLIQVGIISVVQVQNTVDDLLVWILVISGIISAPNSSFRSWIKESISVWI